jgi:predicted secreted protein
MPGVTSQGAKFYYNASSTPVQIVNDEAFTFTREHETADVTNLDSTAREHLPLALMNNGDLPLTLTWDQAATTHAELETLMTAGTIEDMKITIPKTGGTRTYSFNAIIASLEVAIAVGAKQTANVVVRVTGAVSAS